MIDVTSKVGGGSCFTLYFPRIRDAVAPAGESRTAEPPPGGSETILLVEDDAAVRRFASRSLQVLGYRVIEACDGVDALELVAAHAGPLDLLVTDITMPRMQGTELATRLAEARPGLAILLVSGFAEVAATRAETAVGRPFLAKPYSHAALARAVRETLSTSAVGGARTPFGPLTRSQGPVRVPSHPVRALVAASRGRLARAPEGPGGAGGAENRYSGMRRVLL